jgi:hypothetical protein
MALGGDVEMGVRKCLSHASSHMLMGELEGGNNARLGRRIGVE